MEHPARSWRGGGRAAEANACDRAISIQGSRSEQSKGLPTAMPGHDSGFTLIEAAVAASILIMIITGFGYTLGGTFNGSHDNLVAQEATALAVEQIEYARSLPWDDVAMTSLATGAPAMDQTQGVLLAAEADLDEDESLVVDEDGRVSPTEVETIDGQSFTIWRYVSDAGGGIRRYLVIVEWSIDGVVSNHRNSTLISEASTR
jgi:type II secretory pathway pseudopilin PulG